jgi:hypothetical protein
MQLTTSTRFLGAYSDVDSTAGYYTAKSLEGAKAVNLADTTLTLCSGIYGDGVADKSIGFYAFGTSMTDKTFTGLSVGKYYFEVTGMVTGTQGSDYYFGADANTAAPPLTAVPEPENADLLLAGLGALGFAALRRKRSKFPRHCE